VTDRPPLWRCPRCRRRFASRHQSHACGRYTLDHHFEGKPPSIAGIYRAFLAALRRFGPVKVLPEKTRIAFQVRMSFAQLTPRRQWVDGHLVLAERVEAPCIRKIETFSRRNHVHYFRLTSVGDITPELLSLMRYAYAVGEQQHLQRR
jgi:hypothetical protein